MYTIKEDEITDLHVLINKLEIEIAILHSIIDRLANRNKPELKINVVHLNPRHCDN